MTVPEQEHYGPRGDPSHHRPFAELEKALRKLPPAPKDEGRVALIVARRADGVRETHEHAHLTPQDGVPGDRWGRMNRSSPDIQLTVMRRDVAELFANGQPITFAGDNLFVDLDISASNLPIGSRLRVGESIVEVSPEPHNGCDKFKDRFGDGALRLVWDKALREKNLRGVYWKVVESGRVAVGDKIEVLSRD